MKEIPIGEEKFNKEEVIKKLREKVDEIGCEAKKGESFPGSEAVVALVNAAVKLGAHDKMIEGYMMNFRELKEKFEECATNEERKKFVDNLRDDIKDFISKSENPPQNKSVDDGPYI